MTEDTFLSPMLNGRRVHLHKPTDGQILVMSRILRLGSQLPDDPTEEQARLSMEQASKILDIIDSLFLDESDRSYAEQLMITGKLDLSDLLQALETEAPQNREQKRAVKKAAKKAPAKKATKRASNASGS